MGQRSAAVTAAAAAAAPEPTAETQKQGQQYKHALQSNLQKKQFSNLQEKQPYADKWICQR